VSVHQDLLLLLLLLLLSDDQPDVLPGDDDVK